MIKQLEFYSISEFYDLLEILDTHDALKSIAYDRAKAEQNTKNKG